MGSLPDLHSLSYTNINIQNELFKNFKEKEIIGDSSKQTRHYSSISNYPRNISGDQNLRLHSTHLTKRLSLDKFSFNLLDKQRTRSLRSSSVIPCNTYNLTTSNSNHNRHISRQTSVTSSTGTSSVRKLIAVVRSTPSHLGPVYSRPHVNHNFVSLCLAHGMFNVAFSPIIILQSSITAWWKINNSDNKIIDDDVIPSFNNGSLLLAILHLLAAISALFSPFVANKVGISKSLSVGYLIASIFVGIHLYPQPMFLIPSYVLMGLAIGLVNSSRMTYLMILASKLKYVLNEEEESEFKCKLESTKRESLVRKLYRGIMLSQNLGLIVGSCITYILIQITATTNNISPHEKETDRNLISILQNGYENERICGYQSCPQYFTKSLSNLLANKTSKITYILKKNYILPCKTSTILAGAFLGCCVVGSLVTALFLHKIRIHYNQGSSKKSKFENIFRTMYETFRNTKLQFITPLLIFIGIEQGFMFTDFTKFYVICITGLQNTPLIFIIVGFVRSIIGIIFNLMMNYIRRYYIIGVGIIFQIGLILILISWKPVSDDTVVFYAISGVWAVCNAIWDTLSFSYLVSVFPDYMEFSFSHYFFYQYLGLSIGFAYHGFICTYMKLYIMGIMLLMAVIPYAWFEIKLDAKNNVKIKLSSMIR